MRGSWIITPDTVVSGYPDHAPVAVRDEDQAPQQDPSKPAAPGPPPVASSPAARKRMQANRRRDTKPELALRRELHHRGRRFFVDQAPLPGMRRRADLVFPRRKIAVYVDGCFWHSCPTHATTPKTNTDWWQAKLDANQARDRDTDQRLYVAGWMVVRVWEHQPTAQAADVVEGALNRLDTKP